MPERMRSGPFTYCWSFGDGDTPGEEVPVHVYQTSGTYDAAVTVTDADGDTATAVKSIQVTVNARFTYGDFEDEYSMERLYAIGYMRGLIEAVYSV